jgi:hypothetical protein
MATQLNGSTRASSSQTFFGYCIGVAARIETSAHAEQDVHHLIRLRELTRELVGKPAIVGCAA